MDQVSVIVCKVEDDVVGYSPRWLVIESLRLRSGLVSKILCLILDVIVIILYFEVG